MVHGTSFPVYNPLLYLHLFMEFALHSAFSKTISWTPLVCVHVDSSEGSSVVYI